MEGKAALFKTFGDVDAVPICIDTKDPAKIIETVRFLQPSFAGINLEDISSPKCYDIECELKKSAISLFSMTISTVLQLPVWQQLSVLALREKRYENS